MILNILLNVIWRALIYIASKFPSLLSLLKNFRQFKFLFFWFLTFLIFSDEQMR